MQRQSELMNAIPKPTAPVSKASPLSPMNANVTTPALNSHRIPNVIRDAGLMDFMMML
jgi:hypothetical protein